MIADSLFEFIHRQKDSRMTVILIRHSTAFSEPNVNWIIAFIAKLLRYRESNLLDFPYRHKVVPKSSFFEWNHPLFPLP
jgi:hypothetical protein